MIWGSEVLVQHEFVNLFLEHFQSYDTEGSLTSGWMEHQLFSLENRTRKPGFIFFVASILVDPSFDLHALIFLSSHAFPFYGGVCFVCCVAHWHVHVDSVQNFAVDVTDSLSIS